VRGIDLAKRGGIELIDTYNEENNPMYDLNVKLGLRHKPHMQNIEKS